MKVFIGLDVSLASTAICVLSEHGKIVMETTAVSEPEALATAIRDIPHQVVLVGLEAGPLSQWLFKGLIDSDINTVLMETRQVKGTLMAMPIKTDRRDAEGIARLLQMGWFRPVHCKSVSAQETRALLTSRKAVQQALVNIELSVRGMLRNFGLKMGAVTKISFDARVRELIEGNSMLQAAAEPVLRARTVLREEYTVLGNLVRDLARADPICKLMMTMPGVGTVVALTVRSVIDDPGRFRSSKDVGPWVGLTPRRNQSGEKDVVGSITKAGDVALRVALFQAATVMLSRGKNNWLTAWALRVAQRRGKKRATVALARRIGVVLHRMWVDETEFCYTRAASTGAKKV